MKTRITMSISKNEAGLFIVNASDYVLGRQWDNNTTEIEITNLQVFTMQFV